MVSLLGLALGLVCGLSESLDRVSLKLLEFGSGLPVEGWLKWRVGCASDTADADAFLPSFVPAFHKLFDA